MTNPRNEPVTTPRISVVVAFFNNEDDLGDCLDSIAAQSFGDLEVIMVDDRSTDHSAQIAHALPARSNARRAVNVSAAGSISTNKKLIAELNRFMKNCAANMFTSAEIDLSGQTKRISRQRS